MKAPDATDEIWSPVPACPGYEASSLGRVRSFLNNHGAIGTVARVLKPVRQADGYLYVSIYVDRKLYRRHVAHLVLFSFGRSRPSLKHQARHFPDRDTANNRLDNLSWALAKENDADKDVHKTRPIGLRNGAYTQPHRRRKGAENGATKLPSGNVRVIQMLCEAKIVTQRELSSVFGASEAQVSRIARGEHWNHLAGEI